MRQKCFTLPVWLLRSYLPAHKHTTEASTKPHLQHQAIATAINLVRLVDWFDGNPLAPTHVSAFERLYKAA